MPTKEELQKGFHIGDWEVLPARGILRRGDLEEKPEPKVLEVLMVLASRDGDLVTKEELIEEVWGGRPTADDPITRCLSQLRGHLGDKNRPYQYIETLTKRGYRLNHKVVLREPAPIAPAQELLAERARNQGRLWMLVALVVVTVLIAVVLRSDWIIDQSDVSNPGQVRSIAVLPFENLSGNSADQYLVSGFKQVLVQTLHNIPDFSVKHGRVTYPDLEVREIAQILGVDALLFGTVQRQGDTLKINYEVANGNDGETIELGTITGGIDEIFALQERLAIAVRYDLLGESEQQLVSAARRPKSVAFDRYIRGLYALDRRGRGRLDNLEDAIALFEQSVEIDPDFGPAYLSLATAYALLPDYRNEPLEKTHQLAIDTVNKGVEVDESIRDSASAVFGFVFHKRREWTKAEQAYRRATSARVVDSNAFNWYSLMLANVGRLDDSLDQVLAAQKIDPSSAVINSRVAIVYTWLNKSAEAAEFYERANQLGASGEIHLVGNALLLIREGRVQEAMEQAIAGISMAGGGTDWIKPLVAAIREPELSSAALVAIDAASEQGQIELRLEVFVRTVLGDVDGAMRVANLLADAGTPKEMDLLFAPELLVLRQHPGFLDLMQKLGIRAYWDENGCVWLDGDVRCPN
jgi:DNA-binding winged helix-turn-helix (wHTH) protein/TolB-like protein